jgi:crotonobetainyl-CoA:carnitine CoA-transferase CaiB-like acyl-CoA transferase
MMSITGPAEGPPCKAGVAVTDVITGLYGAVAILACLHARKQSGHGYAIDLALLDCAVAAQVNVAQAYLTSGQVPPRQGNAHLQIVPYQLFATADGWLVLAVGNDGQWQRFCKTADRDDLAADDRFTTNTLRVENRNLLVPIVERMMKAHKTQEWQEKLLAAAVPHAPVWNYADLFSNPQSAVRNLCVTVTDSKGQPVDLVGSPFHILGSLDAIPSAPPDLGQDTEQLLQVLLSFSASQLAELRTKKVI